MKKKVIITIMMVLILLLGVIVGCIYFNKNNKRTDNIIINENGVKYSNNIIVMFLNSDVNKSTCEQIAKEIDGNIISFDSISVRVQLNGIKFTSYDEILQYCQQLKEQYEEVKLAMPEMIDTTTVN